jgi:hypothetical protein
MWKSRRSARRLIRRTPRPSGIISKRITGGEARRVPARDLRLQRALRRILADVSFAKAAQTASHASTRTQLYDRRAEEMTLDEGNG